MQGQPQVTTRELLEKLGTTELGRRLAAQRIFRELRKSSSEDEGPSSDLPRLSASLR